MVQSVVCLGTEISQSDTRLELERKTESQAMKDSMNEHWMIFSAKERTTGQHEAQRKICVNKQWCGSGNREPKQFSHFQFSSIEYESEE